MARRGIFVDRSVGERLGKIEGGIATTRHAISFSQEWDKLRGRTVGDRFTTYRRYTAGKYRFYSGLQEVEVWVISDRRYLVKIVDIDIKRSTELSLQEIKDDTYHVWGTVEWFGFLRKLYAREDLSLIKITMEVLECY